MIRAGFRQNVYPNERLWHWFNLNVTRVPQLLDQERIVPDWRRF
jgi:hypothetical protein